MFNTFIYNTTVRNIEDLCLAPFGYAIQLIGDMSYVIRMLPLDSTGRERASERSESPLQAPGFDPSQKQTVEPTRKSKLNKGVHVNASIEKQEKNPGNGSQVQPKEPLMTRLLRWIYPDQRHASRHSVPPLVAYLEPPRPHRHIASATSVQPDSTWLRESAGRLERRCQSRCKELTRGNGILRLR